MFVPEELTLNDRGESIISYADYALAMADEIQNGDHIQERISVPKSAVDFLSIANYLRTTLIRSWIWSPFWISSAMASKLINLTPSVARPVWETLARLKRIMTPLSVMTMMSSSPLTVVIPARLPFLAVIFVWSCC